MPSSNAACDVLGDLEGALVGDGAGGREAVDGQAAVRAGVALGGQRGADGAVERRTLGDADEAVTVACRRRRSGRCPAAPMWKCCACGEPSSRPDASIVTVAWLPSSVTMPVPVTPDCVQGAEVGLVAAAVVGGGRRHGEQRERRPRRARRWGVRMPCARCAPLVRSSASARRTTTSAAVRNRSRWCRWTRRCVRLRLGRRRTRWSRRVPQPSLLLAPAPSVRRSAAVPGSVHF